MELRETSLTLQDTVEVSEPSETFDFQVNDREQDSTRSETLRRNSRSQTKVPVVQYGYILYG